MTATCPVLSLKHTKAPSLMAARPCAVRELQLLLERWSELEDSRAVRLAAGRRQDCEGSLHHTLHETSSPGHPDSSPALSAETSAAVACAAFGLNFDLLPTCPLLNTKEPSDAYDCKHGTACRAGSSSSPQVVMELERLLRLELRPADALLSKYAAKPILTDKLRA